MFRVGLLNRAFNGDLVRDPSGTNKVAFHQLDAMLQGKLIDFLTIDDRDDDLIVANDSLPRSRTKRQRIGTRTVDRLVVHGGETEVAFPVTVSNIVVAWRGGEKQPLPYSDVFF